MVTEWINDAALAQSVRLVGHREHLARAGLDGGRLCGVGIVHVEEKADRSYSN